MSESTTNLAGMRRDYKHAELNEQDCSPNALLQFEQWFQDALRAGILEPNAMTLATVSPAGKPTQRVVLLKEVTENGFVFFTNYNSRKGQHISINPHVCLSFFWGELERQIRIEGVASMLPVEESQAYFQSRPLPSRIGAHASQQSSVVAHRMIIEEEYARLEQSFTDRNVPLPPYWGGYRVYPDYMEFWQGRSSRLHDRIAYTREGDLWRIERLAP
jgi:pyridoxamine 5'-phosphate oxidase